MELPPVLDYLAKNKKTQGNSTTDLQLNKTKGKLVGIESRQKKTGDKLKEALEKMEKELKALETKISIKNNLERVELELKDTVKALHALLQANSVKPSKEVPGTFQQIGSRFLYIERNTKVDWFGAASMCHRMKGTLATVQDAEQLEKIKGETPSGDYWLDITDLAKWGEFISLATGRPPPFFKWSKGRPEVKIHQRCVHLFHGEMKDGRCGDNYFFICQLAQ
ncbi:C-type lectin 37Db-like [Drosophila ficusphila]|uniref:C-type lectin 37Db-like n=1 Tax=Drosophila ficusphila TaxID=30025 RepID=UPI001C89B9E7|nr:C-type lectin 37Db-like [Drosophila ficusphila]